MGGSSLRILSRGHSQAYLVRRIRFPATMPVPLLRQRLRTSTQSADALQVDAGPTPGAHADPGFGFRRQKRRRGRDFALLRSVRDSPLGGSGQSRAPRSGLSPLSTKADRRDGGFGRHHRCRTWAPYRWGQLKERPAVHGRRSAGFRRAHLSPARHPARQHLAGLSPRSGGDHQSLRPSAPGLERQRPISVGLTTSLKVGPGPHSPGRRSEQADSQRPHPHGTFISV